MSDTAASAAPDTGASAPAGFDIDSIEDVGYENGELTFTFKDDGASELEGQEPTTPPAEEDAQAAPTPEPEAEDPRDKRVRDTQAFATAKAEEAARLREEVAYLRGIVENGGRAPRQGQQPDTAPTVDPVELMSDVNKFNDHVQRLARGIAAQIVDRELADIRPHVVDLGIQSELRQVAVQYGDSFGELLPQVRQLLQTYPNRFSFQEAFALASEGYGRQAAVPDPSPAQPARTPAPSTKVPAGRVAAAELRATAARLTPESGVSGTPGVGAVPAKAPRTMHEAGQMALEQYSRR